MAKKKEVAKKLSGAARMRQLGNKRVEVWFDPREKEMIDRAAKLAGVTVAYYVTQRAIGAAHLEILRAGADKLAAEKNART